MLRPKAETIKFLTQDETARLFSILKDKRDRALFLIAYRHGLRASEVGRLLVSDIDFKKLRIIDLPYYQRLDLGTVLARDFV